MIEKMRGQKRKEGGREGEIDGWEFDRDVEGKCAGDLWHLNSFT